MNKKDKDFKDMFVAYVEHLTPYRTNVTNLTVPENLHWKGKPLSLFCRECEITKKSPEDCVCMGLGTIPIPFKDLGFG